MRRGSENHIDGVAGRENSGSAAPAGLRTTIPEEDARSELGGSSGAPGLDHTQTMQPRSLTIINKRGLHARASAKFVQTAERFEAEVFVFRDGMSVGGQSIMGLMMLAAGQGTTIDVSASGPDAQRALEAIEKLVADRFGEDA